MANIDAAFGLRPYERTGSNYNNQGINAYPLNFDGLTTGTDTTGYSLAELDPSTRNTTASLNLKIVGFDDEASVSEGAVDKTVAGRLAIVKLNVHFMDSTSGI